VHADGYVPNGNVQISLDETALPDGADSASLERQLARLVQGDCVGFGTWEETTEKNVIPDASCARYRLRITDDEGRETVYPSPSVVRRDETPPTVPAISVAADGPHEYVSGTTLYYAPQPGSSGSFTVTASSDDAQSGLETLALPSVFDNDGVIAHAQSLQATYTWTDRSLAAGEQVVAATSAAGAESTSAFVLSPDLEPPAGGTVSYPNEVVSGGSVQVAVDPGTDALSGVDPASGVLEKRVAGVSGGACQFGDEWTAASTEDPLPPAPACVHYRYRVSDNVGNQAVYASENTVRVADTTAPSGSVASPLAGTWLRGVVTVSAEASDSGSGVASVRFEVTPAGGDSWSDVGAATGAPWAASWDTAAVGDGAYALRAVTTDADGNADVSEPVVVNVDNTGATAAVDVPGGDIEGAVSIRASGDDAGSGVASVELQVARAGGEWSTIATGPGPVVEAVFDSTGVEDGDYVFRSVVTDASGNASTSDEVTAHVANAPDEELPDEGDDGETAPDASGGNPGGQVDGGSQEDQGDAGVPAAQGDGAPTSGHDDPAPPEGGGSDDASAPAGGAEVSVGEPAAPAALAPAVDG
jgi:hypothetical protein